jgi:hypothetical protein
VVALRFSPASQGAFNPSATEVGSGPGRAYDLNGPASSAAGLCFRGTETSSLSIISSVTVGGGAPPPPRSPSKPKTLKELKVFAQGDLLTTLLRAEVPCGQLGLGALAGLWSLVVPSAVADAAIVPAVVIGAAAGPTCTALVDRANIDAEVIEDPPDSAIFSVARPSPIAEVALPSCTTQPASVRSFCAQLRTDELAYVAAVEHGTAQDQSGIETVVADMARHGIARSKLPPAALVAKPTDILASMSGR